MKATHQILSAQCCNDCYRQGGPTETVNDSTWGLREGFTGKMGNEFPLKLLPADDGHRESVETDFEVISVINQCVCSGWRCGCSLRAHILHSWNILKLCLTTCSFRSVPCPNACAFACAPPSAWHTLLGLASLPRGTASSKEGTVSRDRQLSPFCSRPKQLRKCKHRD